MDKRQYLKALLAGELEVEDVRKSLKEIVKPHFGSGSIYTNRKTGEPIYEIGFYNRRIVSEAEFEAEKANCVSFVKCDYRGTPFEFRHPINED